MVYNILVAPAPLLGLGLMITRRAAVSLIRGPQYPRQYSSDILLKKATRGFLKDVGVKIIDRLTGEIGFGKASDNIGWIALPQRV